MKKLFILTMLLASPFFSYANAPTEIALCDEIHENNIPIVEGSWKVDLSHETFQNTGVSPEIMLANHMQSYVNQLEHKSVSATLKVSNAPSNMYYGTQVSFSSMTGKTENIWLVAIRVDGNQATVHFKQVPYLEAVARGMIPDSPPPQWSNIPYTLEYNPADWSFADDIIAFPSGDENALVVPR